MKTLNRLFATVIMVLFGIFLLLGLLSFSSQAASLNTDDQRCRFEAITVAASLGISDTLPQSPLSKTVYFSNPTSGTITITIALTGFHPGGNPCYLWTGPAFMVACTRLYTASISNPTIELTYPVAINDPSTVVVITSSWEITGSMYAGLYHERTLTFTRDITPPTIASLSITTTQPFTKYLCPVGSKLYYTNTEGWDASFWVSGESSDEGAGLWKTTFSSWSPLGCGSQEPEASFNLKWSAKYCLGGLPQPGVITATSYDYVGNFRYVNFPYEPDGEPPTSTVRAKVTESFGQKPFQIEWRAEDRQCGVKEIGFYYRLGGGGWTHYQTMTVGTELSGIITFTPPTVWLTAPLIYEFASVATDYLGNVESLRAKITVTVRPVHLYLPITMRHYPPSWKQGNNTRGIQFYTPSGCGEATWWAGTLNKGIWKSTDNAVNWSQALDIGPYSFPVVSNPSACNQAFVSVWGKGIYRISDSSAQPINNGLGELYVYGLAITGTTLYAGTASQGVYKTNVTNISWQPVNEGVYEKRIRSLKVSGDEIYAGAKNCKLYKYEGGSWREEQVLSSGCEDAPVWSIEKVKGTLYAGLGQNKGLYHKSGSNWSKVSYVPDKTIYGLAYDGKNDYLYVSTYGAGIYRCWVDGNGVVKGCVQHNQGLTTLNMREIEIHGDLLVAGSDDGIWYLPLFR